MSSWKQDISDLAVPMQNCSVFKVLLVFLGCGWSGAQVVLLMWSAASTNEANRAIGKSVIACFCQRTLGHAFVRGHWVGTSAAMEHCDNPTVPKDQWKAFMHVIWHPLFVYYSSYPRLVSRSPSFTSPVRRAHIPAITSPVRRAHIPDWSRISQPLPPL